MSGKKRSGIAAQRRAYGCCNPINIPTVLFTVTYDGNTNTGGTAPTDSSSPYFSGSIVTVLGNTEIPLQNVIVNSNTLSDFTSSNFISNNDNICHLPTQPRFIKSTRQKLKQLPITNRNCNGNSCSLPVFPAKPVVAPLLSRAKINQLRTTSPIGTLVKTGYTFTGWNTNANGSGISYSALNTFIIYANTILYAQWTPTYTVTYDGNTNTGGTAPIDGSSPYITGSSVTVLGMGILIKTGYTFAGWNILADGSGTNYFPTNIFRINVNTILYAQWVPITYTVTYNGTTYTGGSVPIDGLSPYNYGSKVTVLGVGTLVNAGYTFAEWNTLVNGTGASYSPSNIFTINANTTLYAQWSPTYTVTYDGNTNTGGTVPVDGSSPYIVGSSVTVLGSATLVKAGYIFSGWNTDASGTGTSYSATSTFTINMNTILYAQWIPTYTVTYDGNTNTGGIAPTDGSSPYITGSTVTVLELGTLVKSGYVFAGWNTVANGSGNLYTPTSTFRINANTVLYAQWTNVPPTTYTVTYNGNTNTGGLAPTDSSSPYITGSTVTVLSLGTLVKAGYTFAGWNTVANGSGSPYAASSTFTISANTTLYAQWTPLPTYTVSYVGNTNTGGSAPTDGSSPYITSSTVTVLGNTGTLVKAGYTFAGWNTDASGTGTPYAASSTFTISANTTLYAQWTPLPTYTVSYVGNTNTGGSAPTDGLSPYITSSTVTVLGNTGTLVKAGYTFAGWNTDASGTGTPYAASSTFTISANTTLYAQWTPLPTYTVSYNGNTNTGGLAPTDGLSPYITSSTVTVLGNTGTLVKAGYTFAGWNTDASGTGTPYAASSTFTISANTTLYAQWTPLPTYTVSYNGNTNTGGLAPTDGLSPYITGSTVTVLEFGTLVKAGYTFAGWNTVANGSGNLYTPTSTFIISANTTLYAQWTNIPPITYTVTYNGNTNTGGTSPVDGSSPYITGSTVTVLGNTGPLVKVGYTFAGWNTDASGTGTPYAASSIFTISANTTLYAQWTPTYTVSYNGNTNTGGSAPIDGSSPYITGSIVTVLGNTGTLVKAGYTFAGWNTDASGTGTPYAASSIFTISANTNLYAQWTPLPTYTVSYNGNTNTGGLAPTDGSSPYITGSTVTVLGNTGILVKAGYTFAGWNTLASGIGIHYDASSIFTISANTNLYAQWTPTYTVTYDGNTNTGGIAPTDGSSPYITGSSVTVLGLGTLVKSGYVFAGWNTLANGSGNLYTPTNTFIISANTVLYAQWTNVPPTTYTVSYNGNTNTGGTSPVDGSSPYITGSTVTVLGNTGSLVKTGYTFAGWNTDASGTGTPYAASSTFTIGANTTLYAQWTPLPTYTVSYDGNTNTGGSAPTDGSSPYITGSTVTVLGNTGTLVKAGYTFAGWNTDASGTGINYLGGNSFTIGANTTLYAQWTPLPTYTVSYDGNTNTGGSAPTDGSSPYITGSTVTVLGNTGSLVKTGYTFAGWNTDASGTGIHYDASSTFTIGANTTLYAQWTPLPTYTVSYDGNTNTGGSAPTDGSSPYITGSTVTVLGNTGTLVKAGYTFAGWNSLASGIGTPYAASNTFTISANTTLYAQWTPLPTYTVSYDGNTNTGGSAPTDGSSPYIDGSSVIVLGNTGSLVKTGYTFAGWNTDASGTGTPYAASSTFIISANTTLYAQWTPLPTYTVSYDGNTNTGGSAPTDGLSPYITGSTVTVLDLGTLVKAGYTFAGWNSLASGIGTPYAASSTFTISANTTLYAQWTPLPTYTVSYDGNTNTGGSAPTDGSSPYIDGSSVIVLGNTGSLVKTGYTFAGWNTDASGTGTPYTASSTFIISANTTLYAQWTPLPTYTVSYDGNTNTGGLAPTDASSPYITGSTVTVLDLGTLVKAGYTFAGWNSLASGIGTPYAASSTFTISANTTLYAQWTPLPTYTVSYDGNTNTGGSAPTDGSSPYIDGSSVIVLGNTGSLVKTGYTFAGWNTDASGTGTPYAASSIFIISANTILYAQWTPLPTYTVSYDGNTNTGGSAPTDASSPYITGSTVTVLDLGTLVKAGYTFAGWNSLASGIGTPYAASNTFTIGANTTLYAQWTPIVITTYTVSYDGNTNTGGSAPTDGSSPYITGSTVTVLDLGTLVKAGYTFAGWNSLASGIGTPYAASSTFTISANTTLYAQWTPLPTYTVSYDGNTNTGGSAPTDGSSPYIDGSSVIVLGNTGSLVKTGYTFAGWNTDASGTGTPYAASSTFIISANTTLYAQWTPLPTYTVSYDGNTNTGGSAPTDASSPYITGSTVTVLDLGTLVKAGYTFAGWNTDASGTGTNYVGGNTFTISANTTLYAQWTPLPTYTVSYAGNTNTGGSAPTDGLSPYIDGSSVIVLGNTGSLVKTGYTFAGWNTDASGTGTPYAASSTFTIGANTTLYAQWTPLPTYTVSYDGNTNTGGSAPTDASSPYIDGSSVIVLGNTGSLVKTGYTFAGWNTDASGTGTPYAASSTFTISANTTLYAQWTPLPTYTVSYAGNTNTGGSAPTDGLSPYIDGSSVIVLGNTGTLVKAGYTFAGWNTDASGTGIQYDASSTFTISANTTLYAQWTPLPTYTVSYDGNTNTGGSAPTDGLSPYIDGSSVIVLGNTGSLVKTGYTFAGWNTAADASGTNYVGGNTFTISANTTLYAQWTPIISTTYTVTYNGNSNTSGTAPTDGSSPYTPASTVTVRGNSGSPVLAKTGYQFGGWNTAADGTGTNYVGGNTFTINADTILYANWIVGGVRLLYSAGTSGTGTAPSSSGTFYAFYSTVNIVDNTGPFTNTSGYTFGGWNTLANGSGTSYPVGSTITMIANTTLYAQWIDPSTTYTLTYNAGTGGSGTPPAAVTTYSSNSAATILGNTGPYTNSDPSKNFYGWNTDISGNGTSYLSGSNITMNANKNLYAQWGSPPLLTVTYDANGATNGSVPAAPTSYPTGVQVPVLGQGSLTKPGYTFLGWNGSPTGAGSLYATGYTFNSKTVTLYALWAPGSPVKNCGGGTGSNTYIYYNYPYAMIIKSTDTITIYTTCIVGSTSSNVGSGAAPEGLISIASKMVITSATITINTNTTYLNSANDYNYAYTIENGTGVTYWPSGATISTVTFPFTSPLPVNSAAGAPTYGVSTRNCVSGCGLSGTGSSSGATFTSFNFFNQGITLNYSNGTNTIFVSSPNNSMHTINSGSTWIQTPNTLYPYSAITPRSSAALTTITIIPSTASEYIYPQLPNYTVEYNGNGATGGSIPAPQYMSPYTATTSITIGGNTGSLTKSTAPSTFSRWNTAADGSGTNYGTGYTTTYGGGASIILYAIWS